MKNLLWIGRLLWHHKTRFFFFFCGLSFQLAGLLIEYSDNLPNEYKFIAPSYFRAREGIRTLETKHKLSIGQAGYRELSAILVNYAKESLAERGATTFTGGKLDWTDVTTDGDMTFNEYLLIPQNQPTQYRTIIFNLSRSRWNFSKVN